MRVWPMVSAAVLLTACSDTPEQVATGEEVPAQTATETPIPVEPDGGIGDGAIPLDEAQAIANNQIPARFHGVWDYVEGTCARESDLRIAISATDIIFYESYGQVKAVEISKENALIVTLTMEGEGDSWQQSFKFNLINDGEFLIQIDQFKEGDTPPPAFERPPAPLQRKRCPS